MLEAILEHKWVIAFYLGIILLIYLNRHKLEFQAKIIALYRTKVGVKLMDEIGVKHSELIKILGYIGIGVGFLGMFTILGFIVKGIWDLLFVPEAPAVLGLVLPGVPVPGSQFTLPLIEGLIALFFVVTIHEFSHGVVARAHKLPVKSSGLLFIGPIMGAFVEPEEKKLKSQSDVVKYSVFAAGPWSNILLWLGVTLLVVALFTHPAGHGWDLFTPKVMTTTDGVIFDEISNGTPAEQAGLKAGTVYNSINGISFENSAQFMGLLNRARPNETINMTDIEGNIYYITTSENPAYAHLGQLGVGYLGVSGIKDSYKPTNQASWFVALFLILTWIGKVLFWTQALSLGLGLANLLPIGPVDGGRMIHESLTRIFGEKKGTAVWYKLTMILIGLLIILVFVPMIKAVF